MKKNISLILIFITSLFTLSGCQSKKLEDGFSINDSIKKSSVLFLAYRIDKVKYDISKEIEIIIYLGHNFYYESNLLSEEAILYYQNKNFILNINEVDSSKANVTQNLLEHRLDDFYDFKYDAFSSNLSAKILKFNESFVFTINCKNLINKKGSLEISILAYWTDFHIDETTKYINYDIKNDSIKFNK